jgi:hypothetical protein
MKIIFSSTVTTHNKITHQGRIMVPRAVMNDLEHHCKYKVTLTRMEDEEDA